ncbi:hypothetical protein [Simiduia agarivorans]|uniref:Alpha-L-arabinofuranosidase n=1 Tax=Simiduia agarivorans (strain DSM 21679 / JCM 13881 / BCRC 17597 / SA1) TaxID=1117647 RepID=K4L2M6_SIMAS|nr:hypothetical protein [Simiduia agarivorans]AFV00453.1 hypothetical protein M5M_16610 [Simiduia agarivorans SA1 = DSM 21679]
MKRWLLPLTLSACFVTQPLWADTTGSSPVSVTVGKGTPINPRLFGVNGVHETSDDPAANPAYRALLRALNAQGIRYPSGSPASFWDWHRGHFIPEQEITAIWPPGAFNWMLELVEDTRNMPDGALGPEKFLEFGEAIDAEIQWMLNLTTREDEQIPALKKLKAAGADIRYVEMDNETYFWGNEFGEAERGLNYARRVARLSPAIRELFPDVRIGIVTREDDLFESHHEDDSVAMVNWNKQIMRPEFRPHFDALILHHYVMKRQKLDPYTTDAERAKAFLAYPTATLDRAAKLIKQRFGDYPMWITEYNVIAYYKQFHGTGPSAEWMLATRDTGWNSLYQASFLLNGMNNPDAIEILNHHSIGNLDHGWGLGLPIDTRSGTLTKMGQLYAHLTSIALRQEQMHPLDFSNNPLLGITIEGDAQQRALYGAALSGNDGLALWIINRSGHPLTIALPSMPGANAGTTATQWIYPASEQAPASVAVQYEGSGPIWAQGPLHLVPRHHPAGATVSLPPHSLSLIELPPVSE